MSTRPFSRQSMVFLLAAAGLSCGARTSPPPAAPNDAKPPAAEAKSVGAPMQAIQENTVMTRPPSAAWKEVDRLINEQKMQEASDAVAKIRAAARASGDEAELTRALIREVQLRTALGGMETAVRFLREEAWPKDPVAQATLELFYAQSLVQYLQTYSWEIRQRERVDSKAAVDLKAWTSDQILHEAHKAYAHVWTQRGSLGFQPVTLLSEYIQPNDYPDGIRGTLRDAVTYLAVELFADTSHWRPEQSNEVFRLDFKSLLAGDPHKSDAILLDDAAVHPLLKIGAVLDDLEAWHQSQAQAQGSGDKAIRQKEAALEARLERLRQLHSHFSDKDERKAIREQLQARLPAYRAAPWWAMGMSQLASFVQQEGDLVRAHDVALEGYKAYPDSVGGEHCLSLAKQIEAPDFQLNAMSSDGLEKRSIVVHHKNLGAVHLRAYRLDLVSRVASAKDYNLLPSYQEIIRLVKAASPAVEWSVELPATPDYRSHQTFVTPPLKKKGLFVIVGSVRKDFGDKRNRLLAVNFIATDLTLMSRNLDSGDVEIAAIDGPSGALLPNVEVTLYRFDWRSGHREDQSRKTGSDGRVVFRDIHKSDGSSQFVIARRGEDQALDASGINFQRPQPDRAVSAALVYTDRSIYRPQQKILWKIVAYAGNATRGEFKVSPSSKIVVSLLDANGQEVEKREATTNDFGSAAGEFTIPLGRLLGQWTLRTSANGAATVRVEEYKRPTFEVSFKDPEGALRLNQSATLKGEAKYYFGLPVTNGAIKWRVSRAPVYPWWWGYFYFGGGGDREQIVASGASTLEKDGTFKLTFTPEADERKAKEQGVSYRYQASADLTDEGGETRSATRGFRLGFVSVEATVGSEKSFLMAGSKPGELTITRTSLDGVPRAGKGTWKLLAVKQPAHAVPPADLPADRQSGLGDNAGDEGATEGSAEGAAPGKFQTPGDKLRPRWQTGFTPEAEIAAWKDGDEKAHGEATHDDKGVAKLNLPTLAAGVYRLRYQTVDDFGAKYDTWKDLIVAGKTATPLAVPLALYVESAAVKVGGTARFLAASGLVDQPMVLEVFRAGKMIDRRNLKGTTLIELPVREEDRGGFSVSLWALRDFQYLSANQSEFVAWDNKELAVEFSTFRDKLRPGTKETWRVTVKGATSKKVEAGTAELLAYMYDRSLDVFAPHNPPSPLSIYPSRVGVPWARMNLGNESGQWVVNDTFFDVPGASALSPDRLKFFDSYGIGGMGYGGFGRGGGGPGHMRAMAMPMAAEAAAPAPMAPGAPSRKAASDKGSPMQEATVDQVTTKANTSPDVGGKTRSEAPVAHEEVRSNFSETAFFAPALLTDKNGGATIEFTVPDSVTSWNVWVHAVTKDLRAGTLEKETRSIKDLLVRPYLPRFFREGDQADLKVVVNNASDHEFKGTLKLDIYDPDTNENQLASFGVKDAARTFTVPAGGGANLTFPVTAPRKVGLSAFKVVAQSGDLSDGELRPLPVLPSRMHLAQSRFVTLRDADKRTMTFADLAKNDDPTLINEQMVVTLDAQLFFTALKALPYLVEYPYECSEQTMNRFVSTAILTSVFRDFPAVAKMAEEFSKRSTQLEPFNAADPNRRMTYEESPWLQESRGGADPGLPLINVLNPKIAAAQKEDSLQKLQKMQTSIGGFPWFPGGPPSPYITLYLMYGFAKAAEFGVDVPKDMVQRGWQYLASHYRTDYKQRMVKENWGWEFLTFLNYVASAYPDPSWMGDALSAVERKEILAYSFSHWKQHSPYLKSMLALTLKRMGRPDDATLVFASVMDSSKTVQDQGTFWAPEDRAWLWYNDSVETQAWALRAITELMPKDPRKDGLVLWLQLDKKMNHWKSTKSTAEVIYALVHYLKKEGALGVKEEATVSIGQQQTTFTFEADKYVGKSQIVVAGDKVDAKTTSTITVEKKTKGLMFASATWHFSTDKLPTEERGDFFGVGRKFFRRDHSGKEVVLVPLAEGATLAPGDEIEVQLSLRSKHAAEYVHLRDPRAAGFEPENAVSQYHWDLGINWYEEIRDSGSNFFFEYLPAGEYTFKYRVRANLAGTFRVGPATVQSLYAPEFNAYSAGNVVRIAGQK